MPKGLVIVPVLSNRTYPKIGYLWLGRDAIFFRYYLNHSKSGGMGNTQYINTRGQNNGYKARLGRREKRDASQ